MSPIRVLSCNIRCFPANDGADSWEFRKEFCAELIRRQDADIICFQEMWEEQASFMISKFPDYRFHGVSDEALSRRPMNGILFRSDRFGLISASGYWLSETPHIPGSRLWDSACPRLLTSLCLEDSGMNACFRILNTHLDHMGGEARENQARIICEDAAAWPAQYPQILTGDMNADAMNMSQREMPREGQEKEGPIWTFKHAAWRESYEAVHGADYSGFSYHAFKGPCFESRCGRIDWIFFRGALNPLDTQFITDSQDGRFPSDHYFLRADFQLIPSNIKRKR